jgi:hypothetical protein
MREMTNVLELVWKQLGKRPYEKPRHKWEVVDWMELRQVRFERMVLVKEADEAVDSIKGREFVDHPRSH